MQVTQLPAQGKSRQPNWEALEVLGPVVAEHTVSDACRAFAEGGFRGDVLPPGETGGWEQVGEGTEAVSADARLPTLVY